MGLKHIDEQGNLEWHCPHIEDTDPCRTHNTAHISHEQIQWQGAMDGHHMVSLPPCSDCGAQTFLKVHFTEAELKAGNMWLEWNGWWEDQLQNLEQAYKSEQGGAVHLQMLANQIQQLRAFKEAGGQHTDSHATAQRHIELSKQMRAHGKHPQVEQGE